MSEMELKFQVPPGGGPALLKALGQRGLERVKLHARYFDTVDHLLGRHAMALRLRDEGGTWVQTLKAATPHSLERLEENVELATPDDAALLKPEPDRHAGTEAGARLAKLLKAHGYPPLVEVYRTDIQRCRRVLNAHEARLEWALDEGVIVAGERVRPVLELELELLGGQAAGLYAAAHDWQTRHGLWLDPIPKAQRGALLVGARDFAAPVKLEPPRLTRRMEGDALLRAIVAACLSQILPNAAEIAAGSGDPEHVHQLRVGVRRLRTAVHELESFATELPPEWQGAVTAVFDALGEARDRHVLRRIIVPQLERAGAPLADPFLGQDDEALLAAVRQKIRSAPFQGALLQLLAFAQAGPPAAGADDAEAPGDDDREVDAEKPPHEAPAGDPVDHLRKRLARLHRKITRDGGRFDALPLEEQHRLRRRLKRLRYLAQFSAPLFKTRRVEVWLNSLEPAQDTLGAHIDHVTAARRFEQAAQTDPRAWFAVGWLRARLAESAHDGRKSLERFARAAVFW